MNKQAIVIAEKDHSLRNGLKNLLLAQGYGVHDTACKDRLVTLIARYEPHLFIISTSLDEYGDGLEVAATICHQNKNISIILTTTESSEDFAISALRIGAKDYFKVPFSFDEFVESVNRCFENSFIRTAADFNADVADLSQDFCMIGKSGPMQAVKEQIRKLAKTDCNVLITGETGTGKELAVQLIHGCSPRQKESLVCVNCAALPENLVESELFGSEKGAFTGAVAARKGKFEQAHKGTIFLDEIGDMSTYSQAKILRAIETKKICRVGGKKEFEVDIRGVAATNHDIDALVAKKEFRGDLYYRLNVGRLHIPPLRERKEDVPGLVRYYITKLNKSIGSKVEGFSDDSWRYLMQYEWPGNVRELKNVVESSFIDLPNRHVEFIRVPDYLKRKIDAPLKFVTSERDSLVNALQETNWNKSKAAVKLNWSRMTLYRKLQKYEIDVHTLNA